MSCRRLAIRPAVLVLTLLGLVALLPQTSGDPGDLHCYRYPDSERVYWPGYGGVCAGYGGGCLDCWTECEGGQPCGGGGDCGELVGCQDYPPP